MTQKTKISFRKQGTLPTFSPSYPSSSASHYHIGAQWGSSATGQMILIGIPTKGNSNGPTHLSALGPRLRGPKINPTRKPICHAWLALCPQRPISSPDLVHIWIQSRPFYVLFIRPSPPPSRLLPSLSSFFSLLVHHPRTHPPIHHHEHNRRQLTTACATGGGAPVACAPVPSTSHSASAHVTATLRTRSSRVCTSRTRWLLPRVVTPPPTYRIGGDGVQHNVNKHQPPCRGEQPGSPPYWKKGGHN